jgi:hypothetical protein
VNLLVINLLLSMAASLQTICDLAQPPANAGETQTHGVAVAYDNMNISGASATIAAMTNRY